MIYLVLLGRGLWKLYEYSSAMEFKKRLCIALITLKLVLAIRIALLLIPTSYHPVGGLYKFAFLTLTGGSLISIGHVFLIIALLVLLAYINIDEEK